VPDYAKAGSLRATVIAAGADCVWVEVGDTILFGRYAKFDVPLRGEEWRDHFIMNEDDILAKVHEKGEDDD
jgi:co-chaperonin GroES (HSP10)